MAAIIGNSASRLAGGAGETASIVTEKGYGSIIMADGPAGLRLATKYMETEDGQEGLDSDAFNSILNILAAFTTVVDGVSCADWMMRGVSGEVLKLGLGLL